MSAAYDAPATDEPTDDEKPEKPKGKGKLSEADLKLMRERYARGIEREKKNREDAREDLKFKVGEQWDTTERNNRGDRPCLTFNKMPGFIRQVTGDVRQNKPAIRVRPNGEGADKDRADAYAGLIRNIEQQSFAGYVYAQAIDNATSCGFGAFRIRTEYATDSSFEKDIRIEGIPNALAVVWDPDAEKLDKSDARWVFIYSGIPKEDFKREYKDAKEVDFEKLDLIRDDLTADWYKSDNVRVAEYWCKVPVQKTISMYADDEKGTNARVICKDDYKTPEKLAEAIGGQIEIKTRVVDTFKVVQHIVSGAEELEEPTEWATDDIPIIPVMGDETYVDERCVRSGLIRHAKDAQRAYNYERTTMVEVTAMQAKAPWMVSLEMIGSPEIKQMWDNAGNVNYPYLVFKSDPAFPNQKPERITPPVPAAGLMAGAQMSMEDMKGATGIYDASLGAKSNETSGVAIDKRKAEGDVSTFVFIDNGALAISACGRQLVKLIPKIWDTTQRRRILYEDGTDEEITLNAPMQTLGGQQVVKHDPEKGFYDLSVGKYDIVVDAGPGFTTRRQEAAEGIKEVMGVIGPQGAVLLTPDLARLQDWPGSTEIGEKVKRLLPPGLQDPQTDEQGNPVPPPEPPPDPEAMKAQAEMAAMKDKADFEQAKMRADMELKREMMAAENELAQAQAQAKFALAQWEAQQKAALDRWVAEQEQITARMRAGAESDLKAEKQSHEMHMKGMDQAHQMDMREGDQEHQQMMAERASEGGEGE